MTVNPRVGRALRFVVRFERRGVEVLAPGMEGLGRAIVPGDDQPPTVPDQRDPVALLSDRAGEGALESLGSHAPGDETPILGGVGDGPAGADRPAHGPVCDGVEAPVAGWAEALGVALALA